jgi:predicted transcriptional regulator
LTVAPFMTHNVDKALNKTQRNERRGKMYPNLEAEIARYKISKEEIAESIGINYKTFINKLNGKYPIKLHEAEKIRNEFFPDLDLDYLFAK